MGYIYIYCIKDNKMKNKIEVGTTVYFKNLRDHSSQPKVIAQIFDYVPGVTKLSMGVKAHMKKYPHLKLVKYEGHESYITPYPITFFTTDNMHVYRDKVEMKYNCVLRPKTTAKALTSIGIKATISKNGFCRVNDSYNLSSLTDAQIMLLAKKAKINI